MTKNILYKKVYKKNSGRFAAEFYIKKYIKKIKKIRILYKKIKFWQKTPFFFSAAAAPKRQKLIFPGSIVKTLIKKFRLRRANKKTKNKHDPLKNRGENLQHITDYFPKSFLLLLPAFTTRIFEILKIPDFFQETVPICTKTVQKHYCTFWLKYRFFLSAYRRPEVFT